MARTLSPEHIAAMQAARQGAERGPKQTNPILKYRAKPGLRAAVTAMCAHCMGCTDESIEAGFRKDVRECSRTVCPLWAHRPYQTKDDEAEDEGTETQAWTTGPTN